MATSYNRQINLYINGTQVSNDLKSIRAEMARLVNEQARMTIGNDEYIRHVQSILHLLVMIAENKRQIFNVLQYFPHNFEVIYLFRLALLARF
ncbi:MAG TPA: hypothetical protein VFC67_24245 [Prolixibacteraceae bacterium]|nr:hypothetical protein [Prolixibacteraceae bacterium]